MKWTETITPKQAAEELGVPYHGIKELLEENGAADVPKQAYAQAMAGYMMKNLLGG